MANITEVPVTYKDSGGAALKGFATFDAAGQGKRPGIVVLHEWWGITEHARDEARYFAGLGYTAFVADLYAGKVADNPTEAGALMNGLFGTEGLVKMRFEAALAELKRQDTVDSAKLGTAGYCMGGAIALAMARAGEPLTAVATFHAANLAAGAPAKAGQIKAKVLVLNGADDPFVKPEAITAFKQEMDAAGVAYKFVNYAGAVHAFTNPAATERGEKYNIPLRYDAAVDKQSKAEAAKWFADAFS
jgi:dienelactone hydrolase